MDKYNAAKRLINVLKVAMMNPDSMSVLEVWSSVFKISRDSNNRTRASEINEHINLLHLQIDEVMQFMGKEGFSKSLYEPYLRKIEEAISILNMNEAWINRKNYVTQDARVMYSLEFFCELMPEELLIDVNELASKIDELVELIQQSELPNNIIECLNSHIAILKKSISSYPISGLKSMTNAIEQIIPKVARYNKDAKSMPEDIYEKLRSIWRKVCELESTFNDKFAQIEQDSGIKLLGPFL